MKLTRANYFTPKNKYLTSSKLRDYQFDPYYFYRKHVLHDIVEEQTSSMRVGAGVDCWLTLGKKKFDKEYVMAERRNLKNPPKKVTELTLSEWKTVEACCKEVERLEVYQDIIRSKPFTQKIIQCSYKIGKFDGLAGIPDWFIERGDGFDIIDLKTTSSLDKFSYTARDLNYEFQQAFYQNLIQFYTGTLLTNPIFRSYLLVIETDPIFPRAGWLLMDQKGIEQVKATISFLLDCIGKGDYSQKQITWNDAKPL